MRRIGLAGSYPRPGVRSARAGAVVLSVFCVLSVLPASALLTGCSGRGTGTRDEGPARPAPVGRAIASPTPAPASPVSVRVDAVELVRSDPRVAPRVKRALKRCSDDAFPVDVSYGRLTGGPGDDVVVDVMTCDAVGVGSYVYKPTGDPAAPSATSGTGAKEFADRTKGGYANVFRDEQPPVYAEIDRGDLVIRQKVYQDGDQVAYPSSEDVITYHWSASKRRFTEQDRTHNDYSDVVGGDKSSATGN